MSFLLDTNVISELRKGERADRAVQRWIATAPDDDLFVSVLVLGELRKGVERVRRRDELGGRALDAWLRQVTGTYAGRVLPVTAAIADVWGEINVPDPLPTVDSLLAATALVHGLTLVTRDTSGVGRTGATVLDPFAAPPPDSGAAPGS